MRLTMYHVSQKGTYEPIEWFVDDGETIPEEFLELCYKDEESLPTFNANGIIKLHSTQENTTECELTDTPQAPEAVVESPAIPYSLQDAFNDFKEIVRKLINNKQ